MTPSDLYKLSDLDKRADSGAVSVYICPASGQRAVQLVQSVSEARWTLTVGHTGSGFYTCRFYYSVLLSPCQVTRKGLSKGYYALADWKAWLMVMY